MDPYGIRSCTVALPFCHFTLKAPKPLQKAYPRELTTIGDHLRKKRLDLKLFQKDVAKIIGCDECSIWNWENNYNEPVLKFIPKIIDFLGYVPYDVSKLSFGERIKIIRQSNGLTIRELARELGVDPKTIWNWEKGEHKPTKELRERLEKSCISLKL